MGVFVNPIMQAQYMANGERCQELRAHYPQARRPNGLHLKTRAGSGADFHPFVLS